MRILDALRTSADALRRFLVGQAVAIGIVGVLAGTRLWLLRLPMALLLGLIAALFNFVPFYGPLVAVVPAILMGFAVNPQTALYVALLYFIVKQIEGSVISPQIQKRAVALPPALGLFAIAAFGLLFGPLGVILGAPLTVNKMRAPTAAMRGCATRMAAALAIEPAPHQESSSQNATYAVRAYRTPTLRAAPPMLRSKAFSVTRGDRSRTRLDA